MRIQTLARSLAATTGLALVLMASPAQAQLVSPGNLVSATNSGGASGQVTISNPNATTANINVLSPVVVSNWTSFNVPQATTLNITNGSGAANASLLARVVGGNFSDMSGTVNANGTNLWLLNPNGVLFGNDTSVNAKSLFVSTLGVSDAEFFDYYNGTNSVGNGSGNIRFSGSAASTAGINGPAGARFSTDGTLLFAAPALNLDGTFNAGTGSAAFLAATDLTVGLSAGSPVAFSISAGTSVAAQRVGGSVSGKSADFLVATAAGVANAMLTVDANVATTATAGANGIILQTVSFDASKSSVTVNGPMQSTGYVRANPSGDLTINADLTGGNVSLSGESITAKNVTATGVDVFVSGSSTVTTGALTAADDVEINGTGAVTLASARADSDSSGAGRVLVGQNTLPSSLTIAGETRGALALLRAGTLNLNNVTATNGNVRLDAMTGAVTAGAVQATSSIAFQAGNLANANFGSLVSTGGFVSVSGSGPGNITVHGETRANTFVSLVASYSVDAANVTSDTSAVTLYSTAGSVSADDVSAGGGNVQLLAGTQIGVNSVTATGTVTADSSGNAATTLGGNVSATGNVTFNDALVLTAGNHTISGASVTFANQIRANAADDVQLRVNGTGASTGVVQMAGTVTDIDRLAVSARTFSGITGNNRVGTIAASTTLGSMTIVNQGALTVGTVDGLSGLTASSGGISLSATGGLNLQSNIVSASPMLLSAGSGTITQAAGTGITAPSLTVSAGAFEATIVDVALTGTNQIGAIDGYVYGNMALNNVGNLTVNGMTAAREFSLVTTGNMTVNGTVNNSHTGNLTLSAGGDMTVNENLTADHAYTSHGNISLTAGGLLSMASGKTIVANDIALRAADFSGSLGAATLQELQDVTITDTLGGLYVSALSTIEAQRNLTIATLGEGGLTVGGVAAGKQASGLGNVTLSSTGSLDINGDIAAAGDTVTLTSASGITQTGGVISAATLTGSAGATADLRNAANAIQSLGAFGAGEFYLFNTGNLTVTGPVTTSTGQLGVSTSGNLTVNGAMASAMHTSLLGANIALNAAVSAPQIVELITYGLGGSVTQTAPITAGTLYVYGSGANFALANAANQIAALDGGTIGSLNLATAAGLSVNGGINAGTGAIAIQAGGPLTISNSGGLTGSTVTLSTPGAFINNSGADAITASNRWLVYSAAPAGNTFGGLNSGNTAIWNATLATRAPGTITGNRYVFAYQPTLTVASNDVSKVYGTELTGMLDGNYAVSGLQAGVAGAYLGDTLASVLSGTPTITSAGAAANADVAGGPYAMNVAQGTLAVGSGYALVLSNAGRLTVTPKAIGAVVGANDKTYDGTTAATGSLTLTGVLAGDSVGTSGTTFAFTNKNAGTDKTVTVSGTLLTGADAGNYTLTVPASVLADIVAKAISGTASADGKTYDGTTAATGTVTLTGVVAGDSVGTGGTVFAFTDKNAGTGKTVLVSGTTLTGADAGNYTLTVPASTLATIVAKAISGTVTANSKTYDGTTAATGSVALNGVVPGDSVGTGGATLAFTDKNAGTGKTVTVSGTTLTGADASNYTLSVPATALADILAKAITATVTANGKTYDGTTAASGNVALSGVVSGDAVAAGGTVFTFSDKNAGTGKTVTVSGTTLTGADAGNYTLSIPATALADIVAKSIGGTVAANDKTYDGTTAATGSVDLTGVVAGDAVATSGTVFTFSDKNAGTDKTVAVSGTVLSGADAGNYVLTLPATTIADIFAKAISATVTANSKTYDGTTAATGSVSLSGVVSGDTVAATGTSFAFADKNAGANKTVTVSGTVLSGADAGNYTLAIPATTLASIFAKAITATVTANSKTYDGTTAGSGTVSLSGVIAGDAVGTAGTTFTFADKNAGANKTVTVAGTALTGADAVNYTLSVPTSTLASILQRALLIVANDAIKMAGDPDPALTYTVGGAGLVGGDALSGALAREAGDEAGDYAINQGSLTAGGNYAIAFTPGTLTIERNVVADAALAGQNSLRALPLPSEGGQARASSILVIDADSLCPADDQACRAN